MIDHVQSGCGKVVIVLSLPWCTTAPLASIADTLSLPFSILDLQSLQPTSLPAAQSLYWWICWHKRAATLFKSAYKTFPLRSRKWIVMPKPGLTQFPCVHDSCFSWICHATSSVQVVWNWCWRLYVYATLNPCTSGLTPKGCLGVPQRAMTKCCELAMAYMLNNDPKIVF